MSDEQWEDEALSELRLAYGSHADMQIAFAMIDQLRTQLDDASETLQIMQSDGPYKAGVRFSSEASANVIEALRADLAAAREREQTLRSALVGEWQKQVFDLGWYCLRCGWGNQHAPACILAAPPEPQPASSEPTRPVAGCHVITSRTVDGWASRCPCGWAYEGMSPASVQQAGELHQAGWSTTVPAASTPSGEDSSDEF